MQFLAPYGGMWQAIGLNLGLKQFVLDAIAADNPLNQNERFRVTLQRWMEMDVEASWSTLELAITNANRTKIGNPPLKASKILT